MRQRDRVLLIYSLHCGNFYGTERMALATLEQFSELHRVILAPRGGTPSVLDAARMRGIDAMGVDTTADLVRCAYRLFRAYREVNVISTSAKHNLIFAAMGRLSGTRVRQLNVVHGGGDDRFSYANKRRLNPTRVRLIAISEFVRRRLLDHGVRASKIDVIPNFLPQHELDARPRRRPFAGAEGRPIDLQQVRVAVVSRADPIKRLDVLLDSVSRGLLSMFHFDVYGDGEDLEKLRHRASGLNGQVTLHGYVADVARRLTEADLLLHLCPSEPFGLVILEGMAAGLPVVVPDEGGAAELVQHAVDGYHYKAADPDDLARQLNVIVRDAAALDRIVNNGLSALAGKFSPQLGGMAYRSSLASA